MLGQVHDTQQTLNKCSSSAFLSSSFSSCSSHHPEWRVKVPKWSFSNSQPDQTMLSEDLIFSSVTTSSSTEGTAALVSSSVHVHIYMLHVGSQFCISTCVFTRECSVPRPLFKNYKTYLSSSVFGFIYSIEKGSHWPLVSINNLT